MYAFSHYPRKNCEGPAVPIMDESDTTQQLRTTAASERSYYAPRKKKIAPTVGWRFTVNIRLQPVRGFFRARIYIYICICICT